MMGSTCKTEKDGLLVSSTTYPSSLPTSSVLLINLLVQLSNILPLSHSKSHSHLLPSTPPPIFLLPPGLSLHSPESSCSSWSLLKLKLSPLALFPHFPLCSCVMEEGTMEVALNSLEKQKDINVIILTMYLRSPLPLPSTIHMSPFLLIDLRPFSLAAPQCLQLPPPTCSECNHSALLQNPLQDAPFPRYF